MNRVAEVNRELKRLGYPERLVRGDKYYFFSEGTASSWPQSGVYVYRSEALTVPEWLQTYAELKAEYEKYRAPSIFGCTCGAEVPLDERDEHSATCSGDPDRQQGPAKRPMRLRITRQTGEQK